MAATTAEPAAPSELKGTPNAAGPQDNTKLAWGLLTPATLLLLFVMGYPVVKMFVMSFQQAKLRDLNKGTTQWNNFENYTKILTDPGFWQVVSRTVVFAFSCVIATMILGTLVALLLQRLNNAMRVFTMLGLLIAWSMPTVTATQVWQWIFDAEYGLVNWALVKMGFDQFNHYSWLAEPVSLLTVGGIIVVWGAIPFVAVSLYAGLSQVPGELFEAAEMDGCNPWQKFRNVTIPMLAPIFLIMAALSTIWDFRVFTQVYLLQKAGGIASETDLLGIYAYKQSFAANDFGRGSAVAVVMVVLLMGVSTLYIKRMINQVEEEGR